MLAAEPMKEEEGQKRSVENGRAEKEKINIIFFVMMSAMDI